MISSEDISIYNDMTGMYFAVCISTILIDVCCSYTFDYFGYAILGAVQ